MKTNNDQHDNYLSDWLAGTISDADLKKLVSEADYLAYNKLRDSLGLLQIGAPEMQENYTKILSKIERRKIAKKRPVYRLLPYASIAAALIVLFGSYHLLTHSRSVHTERGANSTLFLADNSVVSINAQSTLEYPALFKYNRKVRLTGEAFFKVETGGNFCVVTEIGTVKVLGTQFNVLSRNGYFEVFCYEGQVQVLLADKKFNLEKGSGISIYDGHIQQWNAGGPAKPSWIRGESSFKNVPYQVLINQFESQYGYKIRFPQSLSDAKFTGSFPNKDIDLALRSVCLPFDLKYEVRSDRTIILSE